MRISDMSNNNYHDYKITRENHNLSTQINELSINPEINTEPISEPILEPSTPNKYNNPSDINKEIDFALQSKLKTDRVLIGSNSDLQTLDIAKEMSGYKRDSVLQEYSYFINDINPEDGFVIKKMGKLPIEKI